jgi:nicotinamide mononucleotide transporter
VEFSLTIWLELIALLTGIGYAVGAVLRNRWAWASGAVSSSLLAWLAFGAALPLQAMLQGFYVLMAAYGFWFWSQAAHSSLVRVSRLSLLIHTLVWLLTACCVLFGEKFFETHLGSAAPRIDAAVTCLSLCATLMTARGVLENWFYWWIVNIGSMWLYGSQALWGVTVLYAVYFLIAIIGWRQWWRIYHEQG